MRRRAIIALLTGAVLGSAFPAIAGADTTLCQRAYGVRSAVVEKHGKRAPGRNICRLGVKTKTGARPASTSEKARYLRALHRLNVAPALLSAGAPRVPPAGTATPRAMGGPLAAIRSCESGGNYATDTGNGFYGAYQFTQSTWASVGGTGNPAAASPAEQDARAAALYQREGSSPWPVCGR